MSRLLLILLFTYVSSYVIPTPEFLIKGNALQVSIPDDDGIEIFYFYGRVQRKNAKSLNSNTIAVDTRDKTGNLWIVKEADVQLDEGDSINYWVFVRKNGVGYRNPTGYFEVAGSPKAPMLETPSTELPVDIVRTDEPKAFVLNDPVNLDGGMSYHESTICNFNCDGQINDVNNTINVMQTQIETLEKAVKRLEEMEFVNGKVESEAKNRTHVIAE